jgi:hypothetical protein
MCFLARDATRNVKTFVNCTELGCAAFSAVMHEIILDMMRGTQEGVNRVGDETREAGWSEAYTSDQGGSLVGEASARSQSGGGEGTRQQASVM